MTASWGMGQDVVSSGQEQFNRQRISQIPGLFLLNPRAHMGLLMGQQTRIGSSRVMLIIALITFIVAVAAIGLSTFQFIRFENVHTTGLLSSANITDGESRTRRGSTSYFVTYEYNVKGQVFERTQQVSGFLWDQMRIGSRVQIRYDDSDPSVAQLTGDFRDDTEKNALPIIAVVIGIPALIISIACVLVDRRNRQLSNHGRMLPGIITAIKGKHGSKGAYTVQVDYAFNNPQGIRVEKKASMSRPDLKHGNLPSPGTPIAVLYVNDKSQRIM